MFFPPFWNVQVQVWAGLKISGKVAKVQTFKELQKAWRTVAQAFKKKKKNPSAAKELLKTFIQHCVLHSILKQACSISCV